MNKEILYGSEYSVTQGCWNIEELENILKRNRDLVKNGIETDYKIVFIGDEDEVYKLSNHFQNKFNLESLLTDENGDNFYNDGGGR